MSISCFSLAASASLLKRNILHRKRSVRASENSREARGERLAMALTSQCLLVRLWAVPPDQVAQSC